MNYKKAEINDIHNLIELRKSQLIDEGFSPINIIDLELKNYFEKHFLDGTYISWIVEEDGGIIATGGVLFYQLPPTYANPSGNIAYITNMFTIHDYRKKGIATHLLNLILEESNSKGYKVFRLHASKHGKSLYQKFGFADLEDNMYLIVN